MISTSTYMLLKLITIVGGSVAFAVWSIRANRRAIERLKAEDMESTSFTANAEE